MGLEDCGGVPVGASDLKRVWICVVKRPDFVFAGGQRRIPNYKGVSNVRLYRGVTDLRACDPLPTRDEQR
jgi:hypothetical protein